MANLHFITDRLATGGDLPWREDEAVAALEEWRQLGITHVVDNRVEWSDEELVAVLRPRDPLPPPRRRRRTASRQPDEWFDLGVGCAVRGAGRARRQGARPLPHGHQPGPVDGLRRPARRSAGTRSRRSTPSAPPAPSRPSATPRTPSTGTTAAPAPTRAPASPTGAAASLAGAHRLDVVRIIRSIRAGEGAVA